MEYRELSPPPSLADVVRCIWTMRDESPDEWRERPASFGEPALPDGSPELIINLGARFEHVARDGTVTLQPVAFLVGQITAPMLVRPTGPVDLIAVRFEAHGAALLHADLRRLTNRWVDVHALANDPLQSVPVALASVEATAHRIGVLEAALAPPIARPRAIDERVALAVRAIRASHGTVALDGLARDLALSMRSLQRLFGPRVGVTPKLLARIVRFQRVFSAWREDPGTLTRIAADCGYFDQSHLVRDFRDFAGMAPAAFLADVPPFTGCFLP
jgi:AraC-like DNA-binding protein